MHNFYIKRKNQLKALFTFDRKSVMDEWLVHGMSNILRFYGNYN